MVDGRLHQMFRVCQTLAEPTGDGALGTRITRRMKHPVHSVELDQLAEIHETRKIGYASRLLQIVGHDGMV